MSGYRKPVRLQLDVAYATSGCKTGATNEDSRGDLQSHVAYATRDCKWRGTEGRNAEGATREGYARGAGKVVMARKEASSRTGIPNAVAFSSLEPASSPATT